MDGPSRALLAILPRGAVAAELEDQGSPRNSLAGLFAEELVTVADASESRRREFAGGRACARYALELLGAEPAAIRAREDGAPEWPAGIVGSITHKGSYRAAALARQPDLAGLGIDAEHDEPLPAGVLESVAVASEVARVQSLLAKRPGLAWDRLLFSAKEAAVKAAYPLGLGKPALRATEIHLDPVSASFTALLTVGNTQDTGLTAPARGGWVLRDGLLVVVAAVAATWA